CSVLSAMRCPPRSPPFPYTTLFRSIYPFDFECADWRALWNELRDVVEFWVDNGVTVFRVDNPHTKPFRFWEWLIADVQARHPERSEEHTSELQSRENLVCRLLLEKK